jgi:cytochrome c556
VIRFAPYRLRQLRDAGDAAYKAAQAKNQDQVLDAADKMTTACSTCHDLYREKTPRCMP